MNYFGPTNRMRIVHPKRMTRKRINCLTNFGSMSFPFQIAFFFNIVYGEYDFSLGDIMENFENYFKHEKRG